MLDYFIDYKNKLDSLLHKTNHKSLNIYFSEVSDYINKTINILEANPNETSEIYVIIKNLSEEISNLLSICNSTNIDTMSTNDISFSFRLIKEFGKEIEKYWSGICDVEIIDTNAEMKLLENILKEDGFFEESN